MVHLIKTNAKEYNILKNQSMNRDFIDQLGEMELKILRQAVMKVHMSYYPEELLTPDMADMLICKLGPETMESLLKKAIDKKLFS